MSFVFVAFLAAFCYRGSRACLVRRVVSNTQTGGMGGGISFERIVKTTHARIKRYNIKITVCVCYIYKLLSIPSYPRKLGRTESRFMQTSESAKSRLTVYQRPQHPCPVYACMQPWLTWPKHSLPAMRSCSMKHLRHTFHESIRPSQVR